MPQFFFNDNKEARINALIKFTDEQQYWRKHSYGRYQLMQQSRAQNNMEANWRKWEKQYDSWRPNRSPDDWQATIVPPYTTSVVEAALSEIIDQTLQPQVRARTREYQPAATVLNFIKDYTWQVGYGDVELYKAIKQMLILGTTAWQESYWQDKRKVQMIVSYNPKTGKEEYKEMEIYDYDDCFGEAVNLWDLFVDPQARSMNTGPYKAQDAIRRYIFHIDQFRNMYAGTKWDKFGLVNQIKPGGDTSYFQYFKPPIGIDTGNYVEVIHHWIRTPDKLVMLANDVPFYIGPNCYNHKQIPFAMGQDIANPWSIYGKGEPGLLESIQDELTTMRRMRLDRQKMDIFKMIFISNRESITDQDLIPAPMKPVYVDDINSIKAFEYGDINPSAYREEQMLKEDGVRVTGIDDRFQSVAPRASTATESAILKESALRRLRMKIWLLSRTLLMEQIRLRVPNILQYYRQPKIEEIMGDDAVEKMLKIREVAAQNRLVKQGGKYYEESYRTITTKNKQLERTSDGGLSVIDKRGDNYFMVTPDLLPPSASVFNYVTSAEPTFQLSKPLMNQRMGELFQHPLIMSLMQSGHYDPQKMGDKLMELSDFDPDDLTTGPTTQDNETALLTDPEKMLDYANRENQMMLNGEAVVATPFATPEHTQAHIEFIRSEEFKSRATTEIIQNISKHVLEEQFAQMLRMQGMSSLPPGSEAQPGQLGMQPTMSPEQQLSIRGREAQGINAGAAKAAIPNLMRGPEGVPDVTGALQR